MRVQTAPVDPTASIPACKPGSLLPENKPPPNNHFYDQVIAAAGHANSHSKVELPFRRHVQVNRGKDLLRLLAKRIKVTYGSKAAIVFKSADDFLRKRVADLDVGRELKTAFSARTFQDTLQRGIERQVPAFDFLIDNRPDLPTPGVGR